MNQQLAKEAKKFAAKSNRSFTQLVEDAVQAFINKPISTPSKKAIKLPVAGDPTKRMTVESYRAMIEKMYDDEQKDAFIKATRASA